MPHVHIHVTGIVQGVGMRPFVYREAVAHDIAGWVRNAGDGVHIEAQGTADALASFTRALRAHAPAAARIENVEVSALDGMSAETRCAATGGHGFSILASTVETQRSTLVSPDIAICDDCLNELFDEHDRRFHYPFINCTNCGPRFTITRALPYDRAATSMAPFPLCTVCAAEYADPADRRFHAQPDACFACGPHLTWREAGKTDTLLGSDRAASDAIIERCCDLLADGRVVAIKGLGGFHLACNAADDEAVRALRLRKRRPRKPFAIMVAHLDGARRLCRVDDAAARLLGAPARPIVLLPRAPIADPRAALAPSVAPGLPELGVMLPCTPLQQLLLAACHRRGIDALVMTSGNAGSAPIEIDDESAWEHLVSTGMADALMGNDRAVLVRADDSVARARADGPLLVRRARGYAPLPLPLAAPDAAFAGAPAPLPAILACGGQQKAVLALTRERPDGTAACFLSPHIGNVDGCGALDAWHGARMHLEELFDLRPRALACDLHPSYSASQWAREQARATGAPLVEVQHHHAHIAAVLAEHPDVVRAVGLAFDGTGAGTDGAIWGGEVLLATTDGYARMGSLAPWRLPGGAAAVRDPRRNAVALLHTHGLLNHPGAAGLLDRLGPDACAVILRMVERSVNSPLTSSAGRLLDAVSALLGICEDATYEGEPACALEAAAWRARRSDAPAHPLDLPPFGLAWHTARADTGSTRRNQIIVGERPVSTRLVLDPAPTLRGLLDARAAGADVDILALAFHRALAHAACEAARQVGGRTRVRDVALGGGVFMNRLILDAVCTGLAARNLTALVPHAAPVNDGGLAYGQAAVARARLASGPCEPLS